LGREGLLLGKRKGDAREGSSQGVLGGGGKVVQEKKEEGISFGRACWGAITKQLEKKGKRGRRVVSQLGVARGETGQPTDEEGRLDYENKPPFLGGEKKRETRESRVGKVTSAKKWTCEKMQKKGLPKSTEDPLGRGKKIIKGELTTPIPHLGKRSSSGQKQSRWENRIEVTPWVKTISGELLKGRKLNGAFRRDRHPRTTTKQKGGNNLTVSLVGEGAKTMKRSVQKERPCNTTGGGGGGGEQKLQECKEK